MKEDAAVAVFRNHAAAEGGVKELQEDGFDMKKLSIVGKDFQIEAQVVGFYNTGDRVKYWGKMGAFWGGIWGLLFGAALLWVPGIGLVALAGPLVSMIIGALEGAVVVGGFSAVGAALYSIGIPKDSVLDYEEAVKAGHFLLVVHGTTAEVRRAQELLKQDSEREKVAAFSESVATANEAA